MKIVSKTVRASRFHFSATVSLAAITVALGASYVRAQVPSSSPPSGVPASATPTPAAPTPPGSAPAASPAGAQPGQLPAIVVSAPKPKKVVRHRAARPARLARQQTAATRQAAQVQATPQPFGGDTASAQVSPQDVPALGKTGTRLADLPTNVQIIPRALINQQGDTMLRQAITNASGVNQGGQDLLGYFDHFLIRGLNAQIYEDGFSDGDQLGGISHSLNGVKSIEVLEGPGSALFGSGPPGGTINIVHFTPSPTFQYGDSVTAGSFGTITNQGYVTGPTTIQGLNYRVDATASRSDGFRSLNSHDYEIRPDFTWNVNHHMIEFSLDARDIHQTPDSYGLLYFHGTPISTVPIDSKYSTPWAFANQQYLRPTLTDVVDQRRADDQQPVLLYVS